ncbi:MAG: hypothetical protein HPY71_01025 [Firmicutes bacterium]|nr:hypothetical protein [Bacillota bacterium]
MLGCERLKRFFEALDCKDRAILLSMYFSRHCTIEELNEISRPWSHMEILTRIRQNINGAAQDSLGYPALVFEQSKLDPYQGRQVTFSWWLSEEFTRACEDHFNCEYEPEIYVEGGFLKIVVILSRWAGGMVKVEVMDRQLLILNGPDGFEARQSVRLPWPLDITRAKIVARNGTLVLTLGATRGGGASGRSCSVPW